VKFRKGQSGNPNGGKREGAGRTPDWLKAKCQKIIEKRKLIEFLADVAAGEEVDFIVNLKGKRIPCPANTKDRISAMKELLDRGYGKSIQPTEISTPEPLTIKFLHFTQTISDGNKPTV
jgi:hypothetical protein